MELDGRFAVVTGGASGLGRAAAEHFVARGARVALFDRSASGEAVAHEIGPERAAFFEVDVSDEEGAAAAVAAAAERFGAIHICLNAAGIPGPLRIVDRDFVARGGALFRDTVMVNLVGTYHVMSHCVAFMARNEAGPEEDRGVVVNVASAAAFEGQHGQSAYAASKAGVVGLALPAARELARLQIRVNTIAPGLFMTDMARSLDERVVESLLRLPQFPDRPGELDEFARLAAHICENRYINGECIRLDAAARLPPR